MGDIIVITVIAAAVIFVLRGRIRRFRRGQCAGGCAGCCGGCRGCMGSRAEETNK